jgi:hypothetical protein
LRQLRLDERLQLVRGEHAMSLDGHVDWRPPAHPDSGVLWKHCQNSVGIARLLVHERRPAGLLDTACHTALEYACRAALEAAGRPFVGDLAHALASLAAPDDLLPSPLGADDPLARLAATERALAWLSQELHRRVPHRSWYY